MEGQLKNFWLAETSEMMQEKEKNRFIMTLIFKSKNKINKKEEYIFMWFTILFQQKSFIYRILFLTNNFWNQFSTPQMIQ